MRTVPVLVTALAAVLLTAPAVGAEPAAAEAGAQWMLASVPGTDGAPGVAGDSPRLSCASASFCAIVPNYSDLTTLSGGTATTVVVPSPDPSNPYLTNSADAVTCPHVGSCVAVGDSYEGPWDEPRGLRETLSGGTWTAGGVPTYYSDVTCNADRCVAVGTYYNDGQNTVSATVADGVFGSDWTARTVTLPWPSNQFELNSQLNSVACPPSGPCVALGTADHGAETPSRALFFYRSGKVWKGIPQVLPAGASPHSSAGAQTKMSCPSALNCIGLGTDHDRVTGHKHAFAEVLANGVLSAVTIPLPTGAATSEGVSVGALDCVSMSECAGTASWRPKRGSSGTQEVLLRLHDGTWSYQAASRPAGGVQGTRIDLSDAACATSTTCVAVGGYRTTSNGIAVTRPAVWNWQGGHWSVRGLGTPEGLDTARHVTLTRIECPSAARCDAVGVSDGNAIYGIATQLTG